MEVAPENWLGAGGRLGHALEKIASAVPLVAHGLLLNLGGCDPIDVTFVRQIKAFLDQFDVRVYGDHLTYCGDQGLLYELLPMPFTADAISHMASRIRQVQDILECRIAVENASYYCVPHQTLSEIDFITGILAEADCDLLLDINNVYVNSINHQYDPLAFIRQLPFERVAYAHIAGHLRTPDGLIIDTHGEAIIPPVWDLLAQTYAEFGVVPTLLERDENIPDLDVILIEVEQIHAAQQATTRRANSTRTAATT